MGDRSGHHWGKISKVHYFHGATRQFDSIKGQVKELIEYDEDEIQTRGWQRPRKQKPAAEANDPPPAGRLPYPQHYLSDPGPYAGYQTSWSSQPSFQQVQNQYGGDSSTQQGYKQAQSSTYPPPSQDPYGHNNHSSTPPPRHSTASGSYSQGYQPPSGGYDYQGSQSPQNYTTSPISYSQGMNLGLNSSNSASRPYDRSVQSYEQRGNAASRAYGNSYPGPSPSRVMDAPEACGCCFHYPDNRGCPGCERHDEYGQPRR